MFICWFGVGTSIAARKREWIKVALYHGLVTGGLTLVAAGASLLRDSDPAPSSVTLVKTGLGILVAGGLGDSGGLGVLLLSAVFAIVFLGIRLIYALVSMT
ncbi:hypothetical protein QQX98_011369 [Neonectria punicea]|uniref:Uncharacterized protein n=1 Tax=Neonectria punicea TaxID=979145 RepID=A0ABR1GM19_9HYPO